MTADELIAKLVAALKAVTFHADPWAIDGPSEQVAEALAAAEAYEEKMCGAEAAVKERLQYQIHYRAQTDDGGQDCATAEEARDWLGLPNAELDNWVIKEVLVRSIASAGTYYADGLDSLPNPEDENE